MLAHFNHLALIVHIGQYPYSDDRMTGHNVRHNYRISTHSVRDTHGLEWMPQRQMGTGPLGEFVNGTDVGQFRRSN